MPLRAALTAAGMSASCMGRNSKRGVVRMRPKKGQMALSSFIREA
ncbi:hypothetical protein AHiyo8_17630 [Arthrobacter sp. Hiyo8]|nr:hypothetical protein AHiyo8_17630 [Arthrobacter sp. Hiyo8]